MMEIKWKNSNRGVYFEELNNGDTFEQGGDFFIKTSADSDTTRATCLNTGHRHYFNEKAIVNRVKITAYAEEV